MRVLITRAENEAVNMAQVVAKMGCEPLVAPMLDIQFLDDPINLEDVQGVIISSGNAVRALEQKTDDREIALYCVGPQTRKLAEAAGFKNAKNSFGGIKNLPIFIGRETTPDKGPLLFLHGGNVTGNPLQELAKARFRARAQRVYTAGPVETLPDEVRQSLNEQGAPEFATFFSIRTFKLFRDVMQNEGLTPLMRDTIALCISPAVADFAREMRWKKVYAAEEMTGNSILTKLKELKEEIEPAS